MTHGTLGWSKRKIVNRKSSNSDSGYILITLMLFVALLAIASLAVIPEIKQQIKRDREEELMHRGSEYMRAIQHFYKKFGRYPTRVEELENTNNIRFLRKRYKDPMNKDPETHKEKDFKILRMQDVNLYTGQAAGSGSGIGGIAPGGPGGLPGGNSPFSPAGGPQNVANRQPGAVAQPGNAGANQEADEGDEGDNQAPPANPTTQSSPGGAVGGPLQSNPAGGNTPLAFGGGPMLGVASTSKDKSVREFADKYKHYNDWLFIYDPTADRGGLLKGPVVPNLNSKGGGLGMPAQTMANQSRGGPTGIQPQGPGQPPQGPQPQMPPDEQ